MRSNACMANRQGDVDFASRKTPPPVRTLAWLGKLVINQRSRRGEKHQDKISMLGRIKQEGKAGPDTSREGYRLDTQAAIVASHQKE